jgi:hypothetical protein
MPIRQVSVSGIPAVALRNPEMELILAPTLGGKITNLRRLRGREWLWHNPRLPYALPVPGSSFVETADSGGWDECFPTVLPSRLPGAQADSPPLPDHGELWSARWESRVYEHVEGVTFAGTVRGIALPYEFTREITLHPEEPVAVFRYRLRHLGEVAFPWIWSAHPVFAVRPGMRVVLPSVHQVRFGQVRGRTDWVVGSEHRWPLDGGDDAFVLPEPTGWAAMVHADIGSSGRMLLEDPEAGEWVDLLVEPAEVPQVGIWLNLGGWAPDGGAPYYNCAIEPAIGAPGRLEEAVEGWKLAPTLLPGEVRQWRVTVGLWSEED